jgi:ACT domain-containing protein
MPTDKIMVHVYLSKDEKEKVAKAARELGISISAYTKVKMFGGGMI